jgi:dTDP-4-dehydrorhamnose 3,5-epimerase
MSFNDKRGTTRGLHAEPWNKLVSVGTGKVFGAWVDLREGKTFGNVFTTEIDPSVSVFVPKGVANSYQTLTDNVLYSYLVDAHWSPDAQYKSLNLADPTVNIAWPIPLTQAELSEKDKSNPYLNDIELPKKGRS